MAALMHNLGIIELDYTGKWAGVGGWYTLSCGPCLPPPNEAIA